MMTSGTWTQPMVQCGGEGGGLRRAQGCSRAGKDWTQARKLQGFQRSWCLFLAKARATSASTSFLEIWWNLSISPRKMVPLPMKKIADVTQKSGDSTRNFAIWGVEHPEWWMNNENLFFIGIYMDILAGTSKRTALFYGSLESKYHAIFGQWFSAARVGKSRTSQGCTKRFTCAKKPGRNTWNIDVLDHWPWYFPMFHG